LLESIHRASIRFARLMRGEAIDAPQRLAVFAGHLQKQKKMAPFLRGKPRDIKDFARFLVTAPCKWQLHSRTLAFGSTAGKQRRDGKIQLRSGAM
jgi:hypothetical protein